VFATETFKIVYVLWTFIILNAFTSYKVSS